MRELSIILSDDDLSWIIDQLMPGYREGDRKRKMIRTLRDDSEMLERMLGDARIVGKLLHSTEGILRVSPRLLFTVLLLKVRSDLEERNYTIESTDRHRAVVFDTAEVSGLLGSGPVFVYLAGLLASFVKINSFSVLTQERRGVWRKLKVSDLDIDSLIRYSNLLDEEKRFQPYRRIADTCLFILGVFPEYVSQRAGSGRIRKGSRSRDEYETQGRYFYQAAARLSELWLDNIAPVLSRLSDNFELAVKPLSYLSTRYLGLARDQLFMQ